jgi:cholesterol transport system auxiliary component
MSMATDRGRRRALGLIGTGLLGTGGLWLAGGCSVLGGSPSPAQYVLSPKSTFDEGLPSTRVQLVVDEPFAAYGLNTTRIALAPEDYQLEYFAGVAWSDRAPAMVQTLIVESFENSGRIGAISRESVDLRPDYILKTEMREFEAVIRGDDVPPEVLIQINAKLVAMPRRLIFANNTFESSETAAAREIVAVVTAFDIALGDVLKELIEWTLRTLPPAPAEQS